MRENVTFFFVQISDFLELEETSGLGDLHFCLGVCVTYQGAYKASVVVLTLAPKQDKVSNKAAPKKMAQLINYKLEC